MIFLLKLAAALYLATAPVTAPPITIEAPQSEFWGANEGTYGEAGVYGHYYVVSCVPFIVKMDRASLYDFGLLGEMAKLECRGFILPIPIEGIEGGGLT